MTSFPGEQRQPQLKFVSEIVFSARLAAPRGAEGTGANAGAPFRRFTGVWNWLRWEFTALQKALLRLSVIPERLIHGSAGGRENG